MSESKRNLPSWMSSKEGDDEKSKQPEGSKKEGSGQEEEELGSTAFAKLMDGVVFALSGFVNPERSVLRSHMLEMGAKYQPDWNENCTLLVCAFPNTPKFKQVTADGGTIVSKDWISECYTQRKLVDINSYLMHVGKPWRTQTISHQPKQDVSTDATA